MLKPQARVSYHLEVYQNTEQPCQGEQVTGMEQTGHDFIAPQTSKRVLIS